MGTSNGCPWNKRTCQKASENGHLKVLQWAHANGCPWDADSCGMVAGRNGHIEVLKWANANGSKWSEDDVEWLSQGWK